VLQAYLPFRDVQPLAALVALAMRHWAKIGLVIFFVGVLVTYTGFSHGTNYGHYTRYAGEAAEAAEAACAAPPQSAHATRRHRAATNTQLFCCSWGFTIACLYVVLDLAAPPAVLAVAAPQAFASAATILMMTAAMYAADAGLVREAYDKYNDAAVNVMNIVLHGVPFAAVMPLIVYRRRVIAAAAPRSDLFVAAHALTAYAYAASYFMTFSPIAQYEIHGISNTLVRTTVTAVQTVCAAAAAFYIESSR
jgi:hypothetical protein